MDRDSTPRDRVLARRAWILLDWASSGFSTVLITLVVAYVQRVAFADGGWGVPAGVVWAWTLAAAMLVSAVLVPWAAAWADRHAAHRLALLAATAAGGGGLLVLAASPPANRLAVVAAVVVACIGFDLAQVFTGSLLAGMAGSRDADRLSAIGFAAGYAGGAIALVLATAVARAHEPLGLTQAGGLRAAFAVTAAWWLVFSIPAAVARFGGATVDRPAGGTVRGLADFARRLAGRDGGMPADLGPVLLGTALVLGAVQTAISQFSSLALQRFALDGAALVRLVLLVQAVALPGAIATGRLSTRCGRRAAAAACLAGWGAVLVLAWFVASPGQLTALAALLALVLGGIQSVLRAAVADLAPAGHAGLTFGLQQVGTKLAGCAASLGFGAAQVIAGEPRTGLATLLAQLALGGWLILRRPPPDNGPPTAA